MDNLQLAPDGVVSLIYPLEDNEAAIGHDLLNDPARRAEAVKTIESRDLTLAGPFELVQGGSGVIGRYPVFVRDESGVDRFWGFSIGLIRVSSLLDFVGFPNLIKSHDYELSRVQPDTGSRQVFARSSIASIRGGEAIDIIVANATWTLTLIPRNGWVPTWLTALLFVAPLATAGASSTLFLAYLIQRQKKGRAEGSIVELNNELEQRIRQRQLIINQAPDPMFVSRVDNFMFTEVNDRACDRYGYSRQEFLTMNIFDIEVEPPLREAVRELYDNTPVGEVVEIYGTNKTKDGTSFPVHVRFAKLDDEFAVANVRDITEQRKNEEKLREVEQHLREQAEELLIESEARFHQVAENLTTALYLTDSKGSEILYANRAWREIWGTRDRQG
ncbi:MAG: PAS domain S-box protein, partial [Chloroflexi bacterium]|nr:PAS domain S-box protein [Chloroflexota bacterium]